MTKENEGCLKCKWHVVDKGYTGGRCCHPTNLQERFDPVKGKQVFSKQTPIKRNMYGDCPDFTYKNIAKRLLAPKK